MIELHKSESHWRGISAIVPTVGRPQSLMRLLDSLAVQTRLIDEVVVADGSSDDRTAIVVSNRRWAQAGLAVRRIPVSPPHAVRQRNLAIAAASGEYLLLLDDDVELKRECVEEICQAMASAPKAVAIVGVDDAQCGDGSTRLTRLALFCLNLRSRKQWQGRIIGPLLRFNYWPLPDEPAELDWIGACCSLVRRTSFVGAGGFSEFFYDRSTMNEDVDLALKLRRFGKIYLCPTARFSHFHDPRGRLDRFRVARDDIFNRYMIMRVTLQKPLMSTLVNLAVLIILDLAARLFAVRHGGGALSRAFNHLGGQISGLYLALSLPPRLSVGGGSECQQ